MCHSCRGKSVVLTLCICDTELLLLGFISLVLARLQDEIVNICIPKNWAVKGLPCKINNNVSHANSIVAHFSVNTRRHLLAEETNHKSHCEKVF